MSRPYYPYPDEDDFELKERLHFGWYESLSSVKDQPLSNSVRPSRPLSFHFGSDEHVVISPDASSTPPNGGKPAWLHALAGFLVVFSAQGLNMGFGVFQAYYEKVLLSATTSSKNAWIGSLQVFFLLFIALLVSQAVHHGHFRVCFSGGSVAGLVLEHIRQVLLLDLGHFCFIQDLMTRISMQTIFASGLVVLISYFPAHLKVATGTAPAGGPFGGIIFPLIARSAVTNIGFAWTFRLFAFINLLTMGFANHLPESVVWPRMTQQSLTESCSDRSECFRDLSYLCMALGTFGTCLGFFVATYYIVFYGQDVIGLSVNISIDLLIAMNASTFSAELYQPSLGILSRYSQHNCAMDITLLHLRIPLDISSQLY